MAEIQLGDRPRAVKAETIPNLHVFLMGNGKPVQPSRALEFCNTIVNDCLDGHVEGHFEFALGFAACFDAVSRGTISLDANPTEIVLQAFSDIENTTDKPNKVTNILKQLDCVPLFPVPFKANAED